MSKLALMAVCLLSLSTTATSAHHKPGHRMPPGQLKKLQIHPAPVIPHEVEDVCLVTTADGGDPNAEIVATEWLPRPVAERLAEEEGGFIVIHPALRTQAGCEEFLWEF